LKLAGCLLAVAGASLAVVTTASATPDGPGGTAHGGQVAVTIPLAPTFAPSALADPAGTDWPTNGGDYGQTRYSTLNEITTQNVGTLKAKWHIHLN
jgi:glucose dehydrogenase